MRKEVERELLHVTITNVTTGEVLKDVEVDGFAGVWTNKEIGQHGYSFLGGINTVRATGIAVGLESLANEILTTLKKETREEFILKVKKLLEEEMSNTKVGK